MEFLNSKSILLSSSNVGFDLSQLERLGDLIAKDLENLVSKSFADFGSSVASVLQIFCVLNIIKNIAAIGAHIDFIQKREDNNNWISYRQRFALGYEILSLLMQSGMLVFSTFKNESYDIIFKYFDYLNWELVEGDVLATGTIGDWFIGFEVGVLV